jgi:hypothetical protein
LAPEKIDRETGRQGDRETRRQGDKEKRIFLAPRPIFMHGGAPRRMRSPSKIRLQRCRINYLAAFSFIVVLLAN